MKRSFLESRLVEPDERARTGNDVLASPLKFVTATVNCATISDIERKVAQF